MLQTAKAAVCGIYVSVVDFQSLRQHWLMEVCGHGLYFLQREESAKEEKFLIVIDHTKL